MFNLIRNLFNIYTLNQALYKASIDLIEANRLHELDPDNKELQYNLVAKELELKYAKQDIEIQSDKSIFDY